MEDTDTDQPAGSLAAAVLASGQVLSGVVAVLILVVLSRLFSEREYATYQQAMLTYQFAAPLLMFGLHNALYFFLPKNADRRRTVLVENLLLLILGGSVFSLFLAMGGHHLIARTFNNPELADCLLLFVPYSLFMAPIAAVPACLMANGKSQLVAIFNVVSRLLLFLLAIVPCLVWPSPATAVIGCVIGAGINASVAIVIMFRACPGSLSMPTFQGLWTQFAFSVPLGLATMLGAVDRSLDRIFVATMCSPESFSIYLNGAFEIPLIAVVTSSVTSVLIPRYTRLYAEQRYEDILLLVHRAMTGCSLIIVPAMAFLFVIARELVVILFGDKYAASADIFRVFLLLLPIRTLAFGAIFIAMGKGRYILFQAGITLVANLIFMSYGVSFLGPIGAAIASVAVVYVVTMPYLLFALRRVLACPLRKLLPWHEIFWIAAASVVAAIPCWILKEILIRQFHSVVVVVVALMTFSFISYLLLAQLRLINIATVSGPLRAMVLGRTCR